MSAVTYYWPNPSFRHSARTLLSLRGEQLTKLAQLTAKGFSLTPNETATLGLSEVDATLATAALQTIYQAGRDSDYNAERLLEEIEALAKRNPEEFADIPFDAHRETFLTLLGKRPDYDRERERTQIQSAPLPVLRDIEFYVDLRAVEHGRESERVVKFVPIVLARVFTDESDVGQPLIFQLTASSLGELKEKLNSVEGLLKSAEQQLNDMMY